MTTRKKISKVFMAGFMIPVLIVTGCGYLEKPEKFDYVTQGNELLFKDLEYQSFYQLFGDMTENDLRTLLQDLLNNLQAAQLYGDITDEDTDLLFVVMRKIRERIVNIVNDEKPADYEFPIVQVIELMHEKKVGDLFTNLIKTTAPADPNETVLSENLYPILAYIMNLDFGDFKEIQLSSLLEDLKEPVENTITNEEISTLKSALTNLVNPNGPYKAVYTQSKVLFDLVKNKEVLLANRPTVGDFKDTTNTIMPLIQDSMDKLPKDKIKLEMGSIINAMKNALISLLEIYNTGEEMTPKSVTDMMEDLWFDMNPDSDINLSPVLDVISALWEEEKELLSADSDQLLYALGRLMADTSRPGYDGWNWENVDGMTDMERILLCMQDLLNPMVQDRDSMKNFLFNVLEGTTELEGADSLHGILVGLSTVSPDDTKDIDTALYKYLMQNDIYGDSRGEAGTDTNMSVLRGILYLTTVGNNVSEFIEGDVTSGLLEFFANVEPDADEVPNYPEIPNEHIVEWVLAILTVGMYHYPTGYHDYLSSGYPTPLVGLDWVYFEQDINVKLGQLPLFTVNGLNGIFKIFENHPGILNTADYVMGAITEPLPVLSRFFGNNALDQYSTGNIQDYPGEAHKFWALLGPIIKHYYEQDRLLDFISVATYLNEINPRTFETMGRAGDNATFKAGTELSNRLGHVLENIEGLYGYGLMYYGLRGDNEADNNHAGDPLDPILDLAIIILNKLQSTPYGDGSLLDYIFTSGDGSGGELIDPAVHINRLFEPDVSGESPIDKAYDFLVENHSLLVKCTKSFGDVMLALHADLNDPQHEDIFDILANGKVKPALKSMIEIVLMEVDEYGIVDATVMDAVNELIDTVLNNAETMTNDMAVLMPVMTKPLENVLAETDGTFDGIDQIINAIRKEVVKDDTDLIHNIKILGYRTLYLYHSEYNNITNKYFPDTATKLNDDTPLFDALDVWVTGSDALYSMKPMMDFINAFIEQDMLSNFISEDEDSAVKESASLRKTHEADEKMVLTMRLLKAFFRSYDGRDSTALAIFKSLKLNMEWKNKDDTVMNAVLKDLACVIRHISPKSSNSKYYKLLIGMVDAILNFEKK